MKMKKAVLTIGGCLALNEGLKRNKRFKRLNKQQQLLIAFVGGAAAVELLVD